MHNCSGQTSAPIIETGQVEFFSSHLSSFTSQSVAFKKVFSPKFDDVLCTLHLPGESYHGRLRSLVLCLCDFFRAPVNYLFLFFKGRFVSSGFSTEGP